MNVKQSLQKDMVAKMELLLIIRDVIKQFFCKHKYREYNKIERVDGKYIERWLICKKCSHHKFLTIWRK